jgi:hypothetical protein
VSETVPPSRVRARSRRRPGAGRDQDLFLRQGSSAGPTRRPPLASLRGAFAAVARLREAHAIALPAGQHSFHACASRRRRSACSPCTPTYHDGSPFARVSDGVQRFDLVRGPGGPQIRFPDGGHSVVRPYPRFAIGESIAVPWLTASASPRWGAGSRIASRFLALTCNTRASTRMNRASYLRRFDKRPTSCTSTAGLKLDGTMEILSDEHLPMDWRAAGFQTVASSPCSCASLTRHR